MTEQTASKVPQIRLKGFDRAWEDKTLGELCEPLSYGLNAAAMKFDGANKYLRITDIDDETRTFSQSDITSPNKELSTAASYILEPGDIVFARTGASVGKTYLYKKEDGRVFFAGFLIRARKKSNVDEEFLFQNTLLSKYRAFVKLTSQRSGQPGINAQEYSSYSLNCPSNQEQTQIGEYFRELDSLIGLHQRKHDKLVMLKKAMLQKMFPQAGANNPEIRFKGFSGDWVEKMLGEVCTIGDADHWMPKTTSHGIPYVMTGDFCGINEIDFYNAKLISPVDFEKLSKKIKPEFGDILFARYASIGSVRYVNTTREFIVSYSCAILKSNSFINSEYLFFLLQSGNVQNHLKQSINTGSQGNVGIESLNNLAMLFPEKAEQQKIGTYFHQLDALISKHAIQLQKLKQIKSACLEKMFV